MEKNSNSNFENKKTNLPEDTKDMYESFEHELGDKLTLRERKLIQDTAVAVLAVVNENISDLGARYVKNNTIQLVLGILAINNSGIYDAFDLAKEGEKQRKTMETLISLVTERIILDGKQAKS